MEKVIEQMDHTEMEREIAQSVQHVDAAKKLEDEITTLHATKSSIDCRLKLEKTKYDRMKANSPF